ncbi:MAG: stalk domain-containing protein [Solirubrobacterales bacterium]
MKINRFIIILLAVIFSWSVLPISLAAAAPPALPEIQLVLDGQPLAADSPPVLVEGRVLVPARAILEAFGAQLEWNASQKTVSAYTDDIYLKLTVNDKIAYVGKSPVLTGSRIHFTMPPVQLDVSARLIQERIMVPTRFIAESMGASVRWNPSSRQVIIDSPWKGRYNPAQASLADIRSTLFVQSSDPGIQQKARQITAGLTDDRDKIAAIHDWIAKNIAYDTTWEGTELTQRALQDSVTVLQDKTGVCQGYSNLTAAMLRSLGIPTRVVTGWARRPSQTWADLLRNSPAKNHGWNQALAGDRWITMDVTWDAGSSDEGFFQARFSRMYFDPSPDVFVNDHQILQPSAIPADLSHYYYQLAAPDQDAIQKTCAETIQTFPEFEALDYPKYYAWPDQGAVGEVNGGQQYAYTQMQIYHQEGEKQGFLMNLTRTGNGPWFVVDRKPIAADTLFPSGAYPEP